MNRRADVSPLAAGVAGKCPRCGEGALFAGYLALRERCAACSLDFTRADSGDGPAVFAIFIVGFLAVLIAFLARFVWNASMPVALLVAIASAAGLIAILMRPLKGTLVALQYRHQAQEGRPQA